MDSRQDARSQVAPSPGVKEKTFFVSALPTQAAVDPSRFDPEDARPSPRRRKIEAGAVGLLAALAATRVFIYCAAFPFFNNVDEQSHFDLVVKYSHGEVPRHLATFSEDSSRFIVLFESPEYYSGPGKFRDGKIPPPKWLNSAAERGENFLRELQSRKSDLNPESTVPPLYYALAALWMRLGRVCGMGGAHLLYWLRFLNPVFAGALVWIGFVVARSIFPERPLIRLGVPALLAFLPQDTFYSIQSDVLSPVLFGLAFLGVVKWLRSDAPSIRLAVLTGLALAAAALTKAGNWPLVAVSAAALCLHTVRLARKGPAGSTIRAAAVLATCAAVPLFLWLAWNVAMVGDLTGTAEKTRMLGWTRKPLRDWWTHPILTPLGLWEFWSKLMASFWRGEFIWFGRRLATPVMDFLYWGLSLVLVAITSVSLVRPAREVLPSQRSATAFALFSFLGAVAFLAVMSIAFDFGACPYPSRAHPFFTSGRLITGALVPFALVFVYGLDRAFARLDSAWPGMIFLTVFLLLVTLSELALNSVAFDSAYNWFQL
jgi:hypothetical protein